MAEPDAGGTGMWLGGGISSGSGFGGQAQENLKGLGPKQQVASHVDVTVPGIKEMSASIHSLTKSVDGLKTGMQGLLPTLKKVAEGYKDVRKEADGLATSTTKASKASTPDKSG